MNYIQKWLACLIFFQSMVSLPAYASGDEYPWKLRQKAKHVEDITTYVARIPGEPVKAFKGVIKLPYRQATVLEAVSDVSQYPEWIYQSKHTDLALPEDESGLTFYMQFNGLWFVSDRDVVIKAAMWRTEENIIHITAQELADVYPEQKGFVRIPKLDNRWQLIPMDNGWTEVHFQTFIDVGGSIPKWLANIIATDAPQKTLKGLKKILESGRYKATRIEDIEFIPPEVSW